MSTSTEPLCASIILPPSVSSDEPLPESELMVAVVQPTLAIAERSFSAALREISVADLVRQALNVRPSALFRRP